MLGGELSSAHSLDKPVDGFLLDPRPPNPCPAPFLNFLMPSLLALTFFLKGSILMGLFLLQVNAESDHKHRETLKNNEFRFSPTMQYTTHARLTPPTPIPLPGVWPGRGGVGTPREFGLGYLTF